MQQLLSIATVAAILGFSRITVEHWAYGHRPAPDGFPSPVRIGRQLRYIDAEISNWISSFRIQEAQQPPTLTYQSLARRRPGRPQKQAHQISPAINSPPRPLQHLPGDQS